MTLVRQETARVSDKSNDSDRWASVRPSRSERRRPVFYFL